MWGLLSANPDRLKIDAAVSTAALYLSMSIVIAATTAVCAEN